MKESATNADAVARAEGTSTDGPRASHPEALSDLRTKNHALASERDKLQTAVQKLALELKDHEKVLAELTQTKAQLARVTAERDELEDRKKDLDRLAFVLAAEDVVKEGSAESPLQERLRWFGAIAILRVELASVKAQPGLVQRVCEAAANNLARAEAAEAALSAHREALLQLLQKATDIRHSLLSRIHDDGQPRELYDTEIYMLTEVLDRLAALASPRQTGKDEEDATRVVESSPPDRAALPQRPTS